MTTPEDELAGRLRDAYAAAAGTVPPGSARELPADALQTGGRRPHPGRRALAAAVAAAAVVAAIVVPRVLADGTGTVAAPGTRPAFLAAVVQQSAPGGAVRHVDIVNAATGRVITRIQSPRPGTDLVAITRFGDDRTFLAVAEPVHLTAANCGSFLYRIRLRPDGHVAAITMPILRGVPGNQPWGLVNPSVFAASAAGQLVAYEQESCGVSPVEHSLEVYALTRQREWAQDYDPSMVTPASMSMSDDGTRLSLTSQTPALPGQADGSFSLWTMPAMAVPEMQAPEARLLFGPGTGQALPATLSPSGSAAYLLTLRPAGLAGRVPGSRHVKHPPAGSPPPKPASTERLTWGLGILEARADGTVLGSIAITFRGQVTESAPGRPTIAADASGGSLVVSDLIMRVDEVSVATGHVTVVPVLGEPGGQLVSAAW